MPNKDLSTNEVIVNGQVIMSTRNDTVTPQTLVKNETATNKEGEKIVGELDPVFHDEAYLIDDPAGDIDDSDYIPFNDVSDEEHPKKKTLFSSIVDKLRSIFATKTGDNITDKDGFRQNIHTLEWLGTDIPDNADLNTYTTAGNYRVVSDDSGATIANLPLALCGKVIVFDNGNGGIEQFYFANHSPRIFVRTKFGSGIWSNWTEIGNGDGSKVHSYETGKSIPANSDLNNYKTTGVYSVNTDTDAPTITNIPEQVGGKLIVSNIVPSSNFIHQFYFSDTNHIYVRMYSNWNTSWSAWKEIGEGGGDSKPHTYEMGTNIPANSDLDNYKTEGVYYVASATDASTISNIPVGSAGKLIVMDRDTGARLFQIYMISRDEIYMRDMSNNSVFSNWRNIARPHTYELGTDIPANSDLNNYTNAGIYRIANDTVASSLSNCPTTIGGKLLVLHQSYQSNLTVAIQIYIETTANRIYKRRYNSGVTPNWNDWTSIASTDDSYLIKRGSYNALINSNDDLNTYVTGGTYGCLSASIATTLVNCPVSNAFKLMVDAENSPNTLAQIITVINEKDSMPWRRVRNSNGAWGEWKQFGSRYEELSQTNSIAISNIDLNTLMTEGFYSWSAGNSSTITNRPFDTSDSGLLYVIHSWDGELYWVQIVISRDSNKQYSRITTNGGVNWSAWQQLASTDDTYLIKNGRYNSLISENDDLNTYTTGGTYDCLHATTAVTLTNCPVSVAFKLMVDVENNPNILTQTITIINEKNTLPWRRGRDSSGSWGSWKKYASTDDITPSTVGDGYAVATVSGSAITATISGFKLRAGVIVAIKIGSEVSSSCTLNISSTGAKSIKFWNDENPTYGRPIGMGFINTMIYDGTYYRIISIESTPFVRTQSYVADTSGNLVMDWGYNINRAQIKYSLSSDKLLWNYYKNSAWRGDKALIDVVGYQTMEGWLGLKTNGGRTIASGAHSLGVSDTIPNILNELRYSNGAWGSFNLGTAYTLNGTTIPTGWYNYFYMPHRVGGENWATPTSWDGDNVNYGTLMLFGMNNAHGVFKVRMNPSGGSYVPVEVVKMADQNDAGASVAKVGKSILPIWSETTNVVTRSGITFTFNPTTGEITANGTATADAWCQLFSGKISTTKITLPKGSYVLSGCPSGGSDSKYFFVLYAGNSSWREYGSGNTFTLSYDYLLDNDLSICIKSGQTVSNIVFKPMLRPAFTTADFEPCEDIHKGNCYVGTCTTAGATKDKVAYVDGYFVLRKGVRVAIKFSNTNTYSNVTTSPITLNVNGTGTKNIWYNTTHSGAGNTGTYTTPYGVAGRYNFYIYDGTYWVWDSKGNDDNSTYSNQSLGNGYGTCATAEATTAKVVTLSGYNLTINGYVSVKFTYAVPANSTMNINSRGAKEIWYRGAKITANIIGAGDLATFIYDGTRYQLVGLDYVKKQRNVWTAIGGIANAISGAFTGIGIATVVQISDYLVQIDYQYTITVGGTAESGSWGLNRDILRSLNPNIPFITPIEGGQATIYHKNASNGWGLILQDLNGYGGYNIPLLNTFWSFSRNYDGTHTGNFLDSSIPVNSRIVGTCYGRI